MFYLFCYNLLFRTKFHCQSSFSTIGPNHFHGLSGYAVAIVYIIHTIDRWLPETITGLWVTRQTSVSIWWSQQSLRCKLSWSTAMEPWILGLQQQAQRPMQSKTRIIVFSIKDWILKFSHTMAISEFWCLGRHLATKVFSLLLHTNKFRKTCSLGFRTKLCYMSSCSTSPFNKG